VTFAIPPEIQRTLDELDAFIEAEIVPLQAQDDNERFFDHRREYARTDFENDGVPRADWEALLREMRRRANDAGWLRLALPAEFGGRDASNLEMAIIREHLAHKGLGLHNDLQNESSIVGNFPTVLMMRDFGTEAQKADWMPGFLDGTRRLAFGLTEPGHGSDATFLETTAVADGDEWVVNGHKRFNSGLHHATHDIVFARTSGDPGSPVGISAFLVPCDSPGFSVDFFWWTFNMPTDHAEVTMTDVRVGPEALFGRLDHGLELAQHFVHENRIRQAASSLGAAQYCIDTAVAYANERITWGKALSKNQGIQFPLIELHTEAAMLRQLIRATAAEMDERHHMELTHLVAMCNYRANRLCCDAADRAMQTCGGVGYSRHMPFEHIYRHHRRYRITEGAEEIQMRKVGQHLFGFASSRATDQQGQR
jgi:acyl-CoA dehydrogenase